VLPEARPNISVPCRLQLAFQTGNQTGKAVQGQSIDELMAALSFSAQETAHPQSMSISGECEGAEDHDDDATSSRSVHTRGEPLLAVGDTKGVGNSVLAVGRLARDV
jgi:hypothetical protein